MTENSNNLRKCIFCFQNEAERKVKEQLESKKLSSSRPNHSHRESHHVDRRDRDRDDSSSVISLSSARSDISAAASNVSYKTALTNTKNSLYEFQKVERKKRMGRGSGLVPPQTPNVQQGLGRGRKLGGT